MMMACMGDCFELGPPPDSILRMPPPPLPAFLQLSSRGATNATAQCRPATFCDPPPLGHTEDKLFPGVQYIELPHHDSSTVDDTWFMVLVTSCIAVVFLGAMLALFLLKCRDENAGNKQVPLPAELGVPLQSGKSGRPMVPTATLYSTGPTPADNRVLWAALTPRGTQHFIADIYPQDCVSAPPAAAAAPSDPYHDDNHYETVEAMNYKAAMMMHHHHHHYDRNYPPTYEKKRTLAEDKASFDNTAFCDYDYEDPAPLIESYQLDDMETCYQEPDVNPYCIVNQLDMAALAALKSGHHHGSRPVVSSPTRIENPNMPPLNLYPHRTSTLKKPSHSRRVSDSNSYTSNVNI